MKKFYLLLLAIMLLAFNLVAQNQLVVKVSAPEDDLEEYLPGTGQTKTVGSMDAGSSDLELGSEGAGGVDPQLVGIRFANVDLPAGSIIIGARLKFTVDEFKDASAGSFIIRAEANVNPAPFDVNTPFNISSRPTFADAIPWAIAADNWLNAGESGADQTSSDLAALVQAIVNQDGWAAGNAIVFTIEGTGTK